MSTGVCIAFKILTAGNCSAHLSVVGHTQCPQGDNTLTEILDFLYRRSEPRTLQQLHVRHIKQTSDLDGRCVRTGTPQHVRTAPRK
jgi:hypothetical protein